VLTHGDKAGRPAYYWAMQLRRGPPQVRLVHAPTPALRLVKAPKGLLARVSGEGAVSVAVAAQEIACAAARQGYLAADLAGAGWESSSK
jgi:hypothetical protein